VDSNPNDQSIGGLMLTIRLHQWTHDDVVTMMVIDVDQRRRGYKDDSAMPADFNGFDGGVDSGLRPAVVSLLPIPRSGENGPQNGPKIGHFGRYSLEGSNGPSVSVGTSKLS